MCAVIQRGILGGFKNKIGNVVGSSWKGIATMRALPLSVANPKTAGQVTQRSYFTQATQLGSMVLVSIIKSMWDRFAQKQSGFNAFVSTNVKIIRANGGFAGANLVFSKGVVTPVLQQPAIYDISQGTLTVPFLPNLVGDALASDVVRCVLVGTNQVTGELGFVYNFIDVRSRTDSPMLNLVNMDLFANMTLRVYLTIQRQDGSKVGDSTSGIVNSQP